MVGRAGGHLARTDALGTDGLGPSVTFLGPVSGSGHFADRGQVGRWYLPVTQ